MNTRKVIKMMNVFLLINDIVKLLLINNYMIPQVGRCGTKGASYQTLIQTQVIS